MDDAFRIQIHKSGFGSGNDQCVFSQEEPTRPKAIAVQSHADEMSVSKRQRGRAVPWLYAICVIAEKSRLSLPSRGRQ